MHKFKAAPSSGRLCVCCSSPAPRPCFFSPSLSLHRHHLRRRRRRRRRRHHREPASFSSLPECSGSSSQPSSPSASNSLRSSPTRPAQTPPLLSSISRLRYGASPSSSLATARCVFCSGEGLLPRPSDSPLHLPSRPCAPLPSAALIAGRTRSSSSNSSSSVCVSGTTGFFLFSL